MYKKRDKFYMKRLFLIGNGFDIAHNLPTKFNPNFKMIAERNESINFFWDIYQSNKPNIWADFENALGHPDFISLEEIFDGYAPDYTSDYESDRDAIITQVDINGNLYKSLYEFAENAEKSIYQCSPNSKYERMFNTKCYFINFNYTHTLETLYGINDNKIIHIHGEVGKNNLIFGYPKGSFNPEKYRYDFRQKGRGPYVDYEIEKFIEMMHESERFDYYTYQAYKSLLDKTKSFCKIPQLDLLDRFLDNNEFDEIVVIGHSCKIDYSYFEFLNNKYKNLLWNFWAHTEKDKANILNLISKISILNYKIEIR